MKTTAVQIRNALRAYWREDDNRMASRPAGVPHETWRSAHPIARPQFPDAVYDTALKSHPLRILRCIDRSSRIFVCTLVRLRTVEIIDLTQSDADSRLARYTESKPARIK